MSRRDYFSTPFTTGLPVKLADHSTVRFNYDRVNRLTEVVPPDGQRLRYDYKDGEPDLRLQMDHRTGRSLSERITSGLTFSSGPELLRNRTEANALGAVRWDRAMVDYRLASDDGVVLPDAVAASTVERIRVMGLGEAGKQKQTFDAPSNGMFIPAEYWAVNCCPYPGSGQICDGECVEPSCNPGGGGVDPCHPCCETQKQICDTEENICIVLASSAYATAVTLCAAGVCSSKGWDSAECITCLATASGVYVGALFICDWRHDICMNQRTSKCPGCTMCP